MKKTQFSPQMVLGILNTCVLDFCIVSVVWSVSPWLFLWFLTCNLVQVLLLRLVVNLYFPIATFLLLPLDKICSQMHIL